MRFQECESCAYFSTIRCTLGMLPEKPTRCSRNGAVPGHAHRSCMLSLPMAMPLPYCGPHQLRVAPSATPNPQSRREPLLLCACDRPSLPPMRKRRACSVATPRAEHLRQRAGPPPSRVQPGLLMAPSAPSRAAALCFRSHQSRTRPLPPPGSLTPPAPPYATRGPQPSIAYGRPSSPA